MSRRIFFARLIVALLAMLPTLAIPQIIGTPEYVNTGSSDFPILYTVGDPRSMVSALNGVAMLFGGGDGTANSFMGSGIGAMVLGSLVVFLAGAITKQQLNFGPWAISVLLTFCLFYPKTTLKVASYFDVSGSTTGTAQLYYVDNVPIGLAIPAGVFGMVGQKLSSGFDTVFTSADSNGGFLAMGTDGFAKPLRVLLGARDAFSCRANSNYCNNLISYGKYCLNPASGVRADTSLLTQVDGIQKFFASQTTGTMTWWDSAGNGSFIPCPEGGAALMDAMTRYVTNVTTPGTTQYKVDITSSFANDLAARMGLSDSKMDSPGSLGGLGIDSSYNIMAGWSQQMGATITADSNAIMMNLVFPPHVKAMIESSSSEIPEAAYQQILRQSMEQARVDMAAEGSVWVSFAVNAMNLFTFLYVAFTPIVALVIAAMGASSFKLIAGYLVFGLWTQTWMPTAAVISYYAQTSFYSKMANLRYHGVLSPENIDRFYQDLASTMATAGTFMAATPMITLSLLTGSIYGLVSLAGKASGGGASYVPEDKAAPDVNKAANVEAISKQAEALGTPFAGGGVASAAALPRGAGVRGPASGPTNFDVQNAGSVTIGSDSGSSVSRSSEVSTRLESAMRAAESARNSYSQKYGEQYKTSTAGSVGTEGGHVEAASTGGSNTYRKQSGVSDSNSYSQSTNNTTSVAGGGGITIGSGSGSRPGMTELKSGDLREGDHGPLQPGGRRVPDSAGRMPGRGGVLPMPQASAKFSAETVAQEQDKTDRAIKAESSSQNATTVESSQGMRDEKRESAQFRKGSEQSKSAERAADEQRIRGLDQAVSEAASAVRSAAIRSEMSESTGVSTSVSLGSLQGQAVQQGLGSRGKDPGMASGEAMRAATAATAKVAGSDAREQELKSSLDSRRQSYLDKGSNDDKATLSALRDMTLSGNADERAVGFKGIAAYAKAVGDPSAQPLSARADRASDNAQALNSAQNALSHITPAQVSQAAQDTGSVSATIKSTASALGTSSGNVAGDKVPSSGKVEQAVRGVQASAQQEIGQVQEKVAGFLAAGRGNAQAVSAANEVYQQIDNAKAAGKITELQQNPEFKRSWDAFKRAVGIGDGVGGDAPSAEASASAGSAPIGAPNSGAGPATGVSSGGAGASPGTVSALPGATGNAPAGPFRTDAPLQLRGSGGSDAGFRSSETGAAIDQAMNVMAAGPAQGGPAGSPGNGAAPPGGSGQALGGVRTFGANELQGGGNAAASGTPGASQNGAPSSPAAAVHQSAVGGASVAGKPAAAPSGPSGQGEGRVDAGVPRAGTVTNGTQSNGAAVPSTTVNSGSRSANLPQDGRAKQAAISAERPATQVSGPNRDQQEDEEQTAHIASTAIPANTQLPGDEDPENGSVGSSSESGIPAGSERVVDLLRSTPSAEDQALGLSDSDSGGDSTGAQRA